MGAWVPISRVSTLTEWPIYLPEGRVKGPRKPIGEFWTLGVPRYRNFAPILGTHNEKPGFPPE